MRTSSAAEAGRSSLPITSPRTVPLPTMVATFTAGRSLSMRSRKPSGSRKSISTPYRSPYRSRVASEASSDQGPTDPPSCPVTSRVTPCRMRLSALGLTRRERSACE